MCMGCICSFASRATADAQARAASHALTHVKEADTLRERFVTEKPSLTADKRKEMLEARKANTMVQAIELKKKDMCIHGVRRFGKEAMHCRWCDPKKDT